MTTQQASTLTSFATALIRAIEHYDLNSQTLFKAAKLDIDAIKNPNARYADVGLHKLIQIAVETTGDHAFGLTVARYVAPTTLHALGFSLLASESLYAAFNRLVRYFRIVSDGVSFDFSAQDGGYALRMDYVGPSAQIEFIDAIMATLVVMSRFLHRRDYAPMKVYLCRSKPSDPEPFEAFFGAPIDYAAEHNELLFDKASIDAQLTTGNAELAYQNDKIVADYLARFDSARLSERVRATLIERLVTGRFSEEQIAELLNLSLRSFQRRLRDEQTSYQQLLDETRLDLSLQYINRTSLSVAQIAPLLGFSDSSNFNRAFKRWLGIAPSKYRAVGFH